MSLSPLTLWSVFFALGIAMANRPCGKIWIIIVLLMAGLSGGFFLLRTRVWSRAFLFAAALLCGALRWDTAQMISPDHIGRAVTEELKPVSLEGVIVSDPRVSRVMTSFVLETDHYRGQARRGVVRGRILVRCYIPRVFSRGDRWLLEGSLYKPTGKWARYMCAEGAEGILSVPKAARITRLKERSAFLRRWSVDAMERRAGEIFSRSMDPVPAGLYRAMILGEKRLVPKAVKDMMIKTGTWHIMVVSGSHTAFLAWILLALFKIVRMPRRARFGLTIGILVLYCLITGATSPVVRATVMTSAFLISFMVERNTNFYHSLALAALVILTADPGQLFDVGFQLSFLSVLSIVILSPRLMPPGITKKLSTLPRLARDLLSGLVNGLVISFSAWIGTAPLIYAVFGYFSPVAVIANTAVVPLAMASTAAGFALLPIGVFSNDSALPFARGAEFFMGLFIKVNALFV